MSRYRLSTPSPLISPMASNSDNPPFPPVIMPMRYSAMYMYDQSERQRKSKQRCPKATLFFQEKKKSCLGRDSNPRRSVYMSPMKNHLHKHYTINRRKKRLTHTTHPLLLFQPFAHTDSYRHAFVPRSISVWNSLPNCLVSLSSFTTFKRSLSLYSL